MAYWQALIRGENFAIAVNGQPQKVGFYTTRWVEADNAGDAESRVMSLLRVDQELRGMVLNSPDDPPMIFVEELDLVEELAAPTGLAFFHEGGIFRGN